ncbi:MAG: T9SS type A sorting domain-containing protein [Flavobacteriales bacterium]|nr:T9SS type A sorting domain-containing protein [Flavobacteriales bacterium]
MKSSHGMFNQVFPVAVEEIKKPTKNDFIIYPNPAKGKVNIRVVEPGEYRIVLRDINGREIATKNMSTSSAICSINITSFASGFYMLTVSNNDFTSTKKFIIK